MKRLVLLSCIAVAIATTPDESGVVGLRGRVRPRENTEPVIQDVQSLRTVEVSASRQIRQDHSARTLKRDKQGHKKGYAQNHQTTNDDAPQQSTASPTSLVLQQDIGKVSVFDPVYGIPIFYPDTPTEEDGKNLQADEDAQPPPSSPSSPTSSPAQGSSSFPKQAHVYGTPRYHGYITISPTSPPSSMPVSSPPSFMPVPLRRPANAWPKFEIGNINIHNVSSTGVPSTLKTPSPSSSTSSPSSDVPTMIPALLPVTTSATIAESPAAATSQIDILDLFKPSATAAAARPVQNAEAMPKSETEKNTALKSWADQDNPKEKSDEVVTVETSENDNSKENADEVTEEGTENDISKEKSDEVTVGGWLNGASSPSTPIGAPKKSPTTNSSNMSKPTDADMDGTKYAYGLAAEQRTKNADSVAATYSIAADQITSKNASSLVAAPTNMPTVNWIDSLTPPKIVVVVTKAPSVSPIQRPTSSSTNDTSGQEWPRNETAAIQSTPIKNATATTSTLSKNATVTNKSTSSKNATGTKSTSGKNATTTQDPSSPHPSDPSRLKSTTKANLTQDPSTTKDPSSPLNKTLKTGNSTQLPAKTPTATGSNATSNNETGTKWVSSNVINFQTVGFTDLDIVEKKFYNHTLSLMKPYVVSRLSPMLTKFELVITFLEKKVSESLGTETGFTTYASVFEVLAGFDLKGDDEQIGAFKATQANALVRDFFHGGMLERLLLILQKDGIHVNEIREVSLNNEGPQILSSSGVLPSSPVEAEKIGGDQAKSTMSNQTVLYATLVTGIVIAISLVAIVLIKRRRQRRFYVYRDALQSGGVSVSSYGGDAGGGGIQPAAIQKRSRGTTTDSIKSYDASVVLAPVMDGEDGDINDVFTFYESSRHMPQGDSSSQEGALISLETPDDHKEVPGAILKCLDGEVSLNGLNRQYPEFEAFVNIPPSPYWSIAGLSYYGEGEEYQEQRRRWHDEANDLALIALPNLDTGSNSSRSSTDEESHCDPSNLPEIQ